MWHGLFNNDKIAVSWVVSYKHGGEIFITKSILCKFKSDKKKDSEIIDMDTICIAPVNNKCPYFTLFL